MKWCFKTRVALALAILATCATSANAQTFTISGIVTNAQNTLGSAQVSSNRLTMLVIDAGDDPVDSFGFFGDLYPGTLSTNSYYSNVGGDGDLFVLRLGSTVNPLGNNGIANFTSTSGPYGSTNLAGDALSQFDNFYIVWFPDVAAGTTTLNGGEYYRWAWGGTNVAQLWELPSSGNTRNGTTIDGTIFNLAIDGGLDGGNLRQVVIPEPSTYALIVMGLAIVGGLRFRRKQ